MKMLFNESLKNLRKEKGLSQQEIANELQMAQRKISYLGTGQLEPDMKTLW